MKNVYLTRAALLMSIFYLHFSSKVGIALFNQGALQQWSFSIFHEQPLCQSIVRSYKTEDGEIKPIAHAHLPLEYYLHKSIPQQYISFFGEQADAWNNTLDREIVKINDEIDQGIFDPKTNESDQKNVIYVINKEEYNMLYPDQNELIHNLEFKSGISKITVSKTNPYQNTPSFLSITDADIMIRQEILSDTEIYRSRLLIDIDNLGIEGSFENADVEILRKVIMDHLQTMTDEDVKAFLIKPLEKNKKALLEDQENNSAKIDEIDQRIDTAQNMNNQQLRRTKIDIAQKILSVDMNLIQAEMSILLQSTIKHEIGHGLGLKDLIVLNGTQRSWNIMDPYSFQFYNQITILREIDRSAVYGVLCLYSEYPIFTQR